MQRLTCAAWSLDDRFIFSGSDEMNIRIWKARAAEKLGVVSITHFMVVSTRMFI
jgi:WD repeat and SOF domain-containing protein 1